MGNFSLPPTEYILERPKKIPVVANVDVVVCGGGPSGIMAALSAARSGAAVILLEQYGFLGGMATAGLVGPISKFNFGGQRVVGGIPEEFINNLSQMGGAITGLYSGNIPYDPEIYKYVALMMLQREKIGLLFHTKVTGCLESQLDPGRITHVLFENKSGRQSIKANFFVDCTGTGDFVAHTSLAINSRKDITGELQPMSLYFRVGGVNTSQFNLLMADDNTKYKNIELAAILEKACQEGKLGNFGGPWVVHGSTLRPGEVSVNATRYVGDASNGFDLSRAEIKLREDVFIIWNLFKTNDPAFKNAYLIDTATQVGIRETRSIDGLYQMDEEDIFTPNPFTDTVAKGAHPVDIHSSSTPDQKVRFLSAPYNIPYRCLVPKKAQNVLVAGGCVSATRIAFASIRVQAQCMALGQASGTAVALCNKEKITVSEIDGSFLKDQLRQSKAIV